MFNKLMDVLAEEIALKKIGIELATNLIIGALLWVDDVVTCVEGEVNQTSVLNIVNTFAMDHKLKWGQE